MTLTFEDPLLNRADEMTTRHNHGGSVPHPPPAVACLSPLHELLIQEVSAALPPDLRARLSAAPSVAAAQDWIAAGTIYTWLKGDAYLAQQFLGAVTANPSQAALALARAFASRMEPPPRDRPWRVRDRLGLALQLGVGCIFLVCRGLLFVLLDCFAKGTNLDFRLAAIVNGMAGGGLLQTNLASAPAAVVALGAAAVWFGLEAVLAPRIMELARQLPSRWNGRPPPLAWRTDTFYWLWWGQALAFLVWASVRYCLHLSEWRQSPGWSIGQQAVDVLAALEIAAVFFGVSRLCRSTITLGTSTPISLGG